MSAICRLCLRFSNEKMLDLCEGSEILCKVRSSLSLPIILEAGLPNTVCQTCYYKLECFKNFQIKVIETETLLLQYYKDSKLDLFLNNIKNGGAILDDNNVNNKENVIINKNNGNEKTDVLIKEENVIDGDAGDSHKEYSSDDIALASLRDIKKDVRGGTKKRNRKSNPEKFKSEETDNDKLYFPEGTPGSEKKWKCLTCFQVFDKRSNLRNHYKEKHYEVKTNFSSACNYYDIVTSDNGKKYKCKNCDKIFDSKRLVQRHSVSHKEDRPFICNVCEPSRFDWVFMFELVKWYENKYDMAQQIVMTGGEFTHIHGYVAVPVQDLNGYHQDQLPSYDAAMAQQYGSTYIIEEQKPITQTPSTPPVRRSERPVRRRVSPTYDYEDGDLYIDESPAPTPSRRKASKHKHYRQSVNNNYRQTPRAAPVNGIESLIQASVLAEEPLHTTEDAAAAMLSISERYSASQPSVPRTFGLANATPTVPELTSKRARKTAAILPDGVDEDEDVIKEVHRDEEYVYPSLEMSSDEDEEWASSQRRRNSRNKGDLKPKSEKDESWSPRARLGRLVPRTRGPVRANVRRECVRAALHAAANNTSPPQINHKTPQPPVEVQNAKRAVIATKSKKPPPPVHSSPNNKNSRLKKGMKTAKQRLGKILKIHKMIY